MVLRLYREDPQDIPTQGRMPVRSAFFGRNEITRRCYDPLREKRTITADEVTVRAIREEGLDPEADRKAANRFHPAHSRVAARPPAGRHGREGRRRPRRKMEAGGRVI